MKQRRPKRPTGAHRAAKPKHVGSPLSSPLDRAYAQSLRTDRPALSFVSKAKRAAFWAAQSKALESQQQQDEDQSVAAISQGRVGAETTVAGANIAAATLEEAAPSAQPTVAGLGEGGIAPPPPPR
jgi:hypothetical protein